MALNNGSLLKYPQGQIIIDLTQSPVDRSSKATCSMDIPQLSPPPFLTSISSVGKCQPSNEENPSESSRTFQLAAPPFGYDHLPKTPNNIDIPRILQEAKSMNDGNFEFLWLHQAEMRGFASTAGGQTTCLRTLGKK